MQADKLDNAGPNPTRAPNGTQLSLECKVLVLAAGAMGTTPLLLRSRPFLPALSGQVGHNLGSTATTGPIALGTFNYAMSEQSVTIRDAANQAMRSIATRCGLGRFMALAETEGVYCAHPLGGCRMAETPDLGVVDDSGSVFGYEGLYCIDRSIVPRRWGSTRR